MCHHYNKVAHGVYVFAHDEKLKLKACLKVISTVTKTTKP